MSKNALVIIVFSIATCIYFSGCGEAGPPVLVITGTVTDAQSGQPIAGAKVFDDPYGPGPDWEKVESGFYEPNLPHWGAVTDTNGNYAFLTRTEHHCIKIEATGYKTVDTTLYNGHFTLNKKNKKDEEAFNVALERK